MSRLGDATRLILVVGLLHAGCARPPAVAVALEAGEAALTAALEGGADANARDVHGDAPVHLAASHDKPGAMEVLLRHGADVGALDGDGETPLYVAASHDASECAYLLLAHRADPNQRSGPERKSALHAAVAREHVDVARVLLEGGADPDARDAWGTTPLQLAATLEADRSAPIARLLVAHGARLEARDLRGYTALHVAAAHDALGFVELYRDRGLDLSAPSTLGTTPLEIALEASSVRVADALYRAGARTDVVRDFVPPLHRAARLDDVETALRLLAYGVDPGDLFEGKTACDVARESRSPGVLDLLTRATLAPR